MEDWRLRGQEEYLTNTTLYKITFPAFWQIAYRDKNAFFRRIAAYARRFVAETGRGQDYLEGEKIQHFWHEHCEFCWEKALTDKPCVFYCTENMNYWICEECFQDFQEQFHWQVKSMEELFGQPYGIRIHRNHDSTR